MTAAPAWPRSSSTTDFDFKAFADHLAARLPAYAHPLFIRISASLDSTETFKQKKHQS